MCGLAKALGCVILLISIGVLSADSLAQVGPSARKSRPLHGMRVSGRWYRATSAFNTPIPARAAVASQNASLIDAFSDPNAFAHGGLGYSRDWVPAVWIANNSTRAKPVRILSKKSTYCCVPIPLKAVPDPSSEGQMTVMQKDTGAEWDFYKAVKNRDGTWQAALVKKTAWTGSGSTRGVPRGSHTNLGAGLTRPRDTGRPRGSTWDHALAFSYEGTLAGKYTAPALTSDGTCTDPRKCVPMGARFQLDPRLNCNTWPSLIYEWQRQVCRTLLKYGMIVVNTTIGGPTLIEQHSNSLGPYKYPWERYGGAWGLMPDDLLSHFRVLARTRARHP
jgi:hypothetical protein